MQEASCSERWSQNQDDHLSILTAHLNLGTRALRETDPPVKITEPSSDLDSSRYQCPEDMAQLKEIYMDTFGSEMKPPSSPSPDAITSLIEVYNMVIKTDHMCFNYNM